MPRRSSTLVSQYVFFARSLFTSLDVVVVVNLRWGDDDDVVHEDSCVLKNHTPHATTRRRVPRIGTRENHWSMDRRVQPATVLGNGAPRSFCEDDRWKMKNVCC